MLAVSTDMLRKQEQICSCWDIKMKGCPLSGNGMFSNKVVSKAPKAVTANRLDLGEIHKSMKGFKKKKNKSQCRWSCTGPDPTAGRVHILSTPSCFWHQIPILQELHPQSHTGRVVSTANVPVQSTDFSKDADCEPEHDPHWHVGAGKSCECQRVLISDNNKTWLVKGKETKSSSGESDGCWISALNIFQPSSCPQLRYRTQGA